MKTYKDFNYFDVHKKVHKKNIMIKEWDSFSRFSCLDSKCPDFNFVRTKI